MQPKPRLISLTTIHIDTPPRRVRRKQIQRRGFVCSCSTDADPRAVVGRRTHSHIELARAGKEPARVWLPNRR